MMSGYSANEDSDDEFLLFLHKTNLNVSRLSTKVEEEEKHKISACVQKVEEKMESLTISSDESGAFTSDSENELEFLKFSEKIRYCLTPQTTKNIKISSKSGNVKSESDLPDLGKSDKTASSFCDSQKLSRTMKHNLLSVDDLEFLFPPEDANVPVTSGNQKSYSTKLYEIFNKSVFENKLPGDMHIKWTNSLGSTAGKTHCNKKGKEYSCYISLSVKVLNSFDRLRDTLLHEMCHAAVWMINKISHINHGPLWHSWALRCKIILPQLDLPERCHNYEIDFPIYYMCTSCNYKIGRMRRSQKLEKSICKQCRVHFVLVKN